MLTSKHVFAGMAIVTEHGASSTSKMLQLFEGYLEAKNVADEESYDRVREGVVVFLGTLAQHLDPAGRKVSCFQMHTMQSAADTVPFISSTAGVPLKP